ASVVGAVRAVSQCHDRVIVVALAPVPLLSTDPRAVPSDEDSRAARLMVVATASPVRSGTFLVTVARGAPGLSWQTLRPALLMGWESVPVVASPNAATWTTWR